MNKVLVILAAATMILASAPSAQATVSQNPSEQNQQPKKPAKKVSQTRVVTFKSDIHCKNCAAKLRDNVSFEKGVKDLKISVEEKRITITYDTAKTSVEQLAAAVNKLGYSAVVESDEKVEK